MNKLKGFTLLETVISIFIITLVFTAVTSLEIMKDNLENEMECNSDIYEVQNMLILSKAVCKKDNNKGHMLINTKGKEIYFYLDSGGSSLFRKIKLSNNSDCLGKNINLYLTSRGKITSGTTITIKNAEEIENITIGGGVDTIKIKD